MGVNKGQITGKRESEMKTYSAKPQDIRREWHLVDATDKILGRLATEVAHRLRGKHKPMYTPSMDTGDHIVVINAEKIKVTGKKLDDKFYHRFTGYIGNLKSVNLKKTLDLHPERVIEHAVKGMLPKNPLGRAMYKKLHVYAGSEHPHTAQQPSALEINTDTKRNR
ncbi:MAG: large subunit ribosomal protein L13 [Lysobacterales bacterium]|jgi:large subunit ribosomal protein L13